MNLEFDRERIENYIFNTLTNTHPILRALKNGKLVIFVGAGLSVHLRIPSWRDFALKYLDMMYEKNIMTSMNFKTKESLKADDTKKILSICQYISKKNLLTKELVEQYEKWFKTQRSTVLSGRIYEKLYRLNAIYLTTNYDNALDLIAEDYSETIVSDQTNDSETTPAEDFKKVYYDIREFSKEILKPQNVVHVHGSIHDISSMVVSYGDYIERYGHRSSKINNQVREIYSDFMSEIFNEKDYVVLFIGYGLEEIEILQFLFEGELKGSKTLSNSRYLILPCYSDDYLKISYLSDYYKDNFGVSVIPCDMSEKGYDILEDVIDHLLDLSKGTYQEKNEVVELKEGLKAIEEMFL